MFRNIFPSCWFFNCFCYHNVWLIIWISQLPIFHISPHWKTISVIATSDQLITKNSQLSKKPCAYLWWCESDVNLTWVSKCLIETKEPDLVSYRLLLCFDLWGRCISKNGNLYIADTRPNKYFFTEPSL